MAVSSKSTVGKIGKACYMLTSHEWDKELMECWVTESKSLTWS